jgi:signal transduction histidine kinase
VIIRGEIDKSGQLQGQRISITDNGPGIPAEALTKIFMPFYTTKTNGTGLGLAVVQKIVVQHGGSVEARNQPLGGAEFLVWLPFVRESVRAIDSASARI